MRTLKELFPVGKWTLAWLVAIGTLALVAALTGGR